MFRRMKLSHRVAALAVATLLFPGLRAFAQSSSSSSGDEFEQDDGKPKPKSDKSEETSAQPDAPPAPAAAAALAAPAAPEPGSDNPYVPFAPSPGPLGIAVPNASIHFGLLLQPAFEMVGSSTAELTTKNLFLRRTRFIFGGTLFSSFEYFVDFDWPNLFKLDGGDTMAGTVKNAPGLNIQDAFATAKVWSDFIDFDAGFMLPPLSHNNIESAAKLYGPDYFVNSFRRTYVAGDTDPFASAGQNPQGRDLGIQLRGIVAGGHIEYRGGLFQGFRVSEVPGPPSMVGGLNFFRVAARLQVNILDAEPGFFKAGTYLGTKKIFSIGGFVDFQKSYKYFGFDVLIDLPLGPGIFTLQADVVRWDGGTFIMLPKHTAYMGEVGYLFGAIRLSPIFRYERLVGQSLASDPTMVDPSDPNETRIGGGLAFWPYGHNSNFKAFYSRVHYEPGTQDYNQINAQWQLYFY
jgi:hypothetical protein